MKRIIRIFDLEGHISVEADPNRGVVVACEIGSVTTKFGLWPEDARKIGEEIIEAADELGRKGFDGRTEGP